MKLQLAFGSLYGHTGRRAALAPVALLMAGLSIVAYATLDDEPVTTAAVVLVLDNSGSHEMPDWADLAAFADAVGPQTQLAVVVFDTTARVELPLGDMESPERRAAFDAAIAATDGRGQNTVLNAGLGKAFELLTEAGPLIVERHIVFFSDGISDPPWHMSKDSLLHDWNERLVPSCAASGIIVSVVCPPGEADLAKMERLASATKGLFVVTREPQAVVSTILPDVLLRPDPAATAQVVPIPNGGLRNALPFAVLLVVLAAVAATLVIRYAKSRSQKAVHPRRQDGETGLAGLAEAVAGLRELAGQLGETGGQLRDVAARVEASGCEAFTERQTAKERTLKLLGEVMSVRDEVEDIHQGIAADDALRENMEFVDELLSKVLVSVRVKEMTVLVGKHYDPTLHEPRPESNSAPRGTILRVERKGYMVRQATSSDKVLRFAKVVVSDGSGIKEA